MVAASAAMTTVATASMVAASAAMAAVTAMANKLHVRLTCAFAFLVENIEGRQAYVGDFLLAQSDGVVISGAWSSHVG
jgi:hypothetical protein